MHGADISVVSKMLGHASVTITCDIYRYVMPGETARIANVFQEMLNGQYVESAAYEKNTCTNI